jgi:hypothetical protein
MRKYLLSKYACSHGYSEIQVAVFADLSFTIYHSCGAAEVSSPKAEVAS